MTKAPIFLLGLLIASSTAQAQAPQLRPAPAIALWTPAPYTFPADTSGDTGKNATILGGVLGAVGGLLIYNTFSGLGEGTSKGSSLIPMAIALVGGGNGRAQLFHPQLRFPRIAAKDDTDQIHGLPPGIPRTRAAPRRRPAGDRRAG